MKSQIALLMLVALMGAAIGGCSDEPSDEIVLQGVIYTVLYETGNGQTQGLTRVNTPKAVPGGTGSWNVNAEGKLTRDFLLIRFPDGPDLGYKAIPVHRLISVQFGDGGIEQVASQPNVE